MAPYVASDASDATTMMIFQRSHAFSKWRSNICKLIGGTAIIAMPPIIVLSFSRTGRVNVSETPLICWGLRMGVVEFVVEQNVLKGHGK